MSSEYVAVKGGKLRLKGSAGNKLKKKSKRKRSQSSRELGYAEGDLKHETWCKVSSLEELKERAIFETASGGYIVADDTGYFSVGEPKEYDAPLEPAEKFTVVRVSENKIALKTGYGRYVSVNSAGELIGRMEAIGPRETWEPVFEDGRLALCACTHRFVSAVKGKKLIAASEKAQESEILKVYSDISNKTEEQSLEELEAELSSHDLRGFETDFVKKFQSGKKLRVCGESRQGLKKAKDGGKLHEALLDRREKMKADRYCK